jgi:glycosyltransferase involved in cell wall biosynthesis
MAETAEGGGALLVEPRDVNALAEQMRRLLTDDTLLDELEAQARARDFGSWESYAEDLWSFFVPAS